MKNFTDIKKFALDKAALLGLLVLALFVAKWVVDSRSGVKLTESVVLNPMGLSVKMPQGNGWQSAVRWRFLDSYYLIDGIYIHPAHRQKTSAIKCQYLLTPQNLTPKEIFLQKASQLGARILDTSKLTSGSLSFEWAQMLDQQGQNRFMAVTKLPDERQLNIELYEWANDADYAKRTFKTVLRNIAFEDNKLLSYGAKLVTQIKETGLDSFLPRPQKDFFLVKDSKKNNLGFVMDLLTETGPYDQLSVKAISFTYFDQPSPFETFSAFQGDNAFDEFSWKQETSTSQVAQITLEHGTLNVRKTFPRPQQIIMELNPAAIPDVFLKQLFGQLLNCDRDRILVDIIEQGGSVIPTLIKKINIPQNYSHALRIQLLDDNRRFQDIYFDKKLDFIKIHQPEKNIILEKTSMENIMKMFPQKAEHIQNINNEFNVLQLQ